MSNLRRLDLAWQSATSKECKYGTHVRPKTLGLGSQPSPRNVGLTLMSDLRRLNFIVSQDLAVNQVQGDVGVEKISNPRHLDLVVSQVQGDDHPLACPGK